MGANQGVFVTPGGIALDVGQRLPVEGHGGIMGNIYILGKSSGKDGNE